MITYPIDFIFENIPYEAMVMKITVDHLDVFHVYHISPKHPAIDEPFTFVINGKREITWPYKNKLQLSFGSVISGQLVPKYAEKQAALV